MAALRSCMRAVAAGSCAMVIKPRINRLRNITFYRNPDSEVKRRYECSAEYQIVIDFKTRKKRHGVAFRRLSCGSANTARTNRTVASNAWHTLRVDFQGSHFTVTHEGR